MEKTVMALSGAANVGKSTTIMKVRDLLKSKHGCVVEPEGTLEIDVDVRVVLRINGVRIGIESQGDPGGRLEESLLRFVELGCTAIICATRTRGRTVDAVNKLKPSYNVVWLQQDVKSSASGQEASNDAMAERIARNIEKAIGA